MHHLSRELLQERAKVKALSEELETPMNVHRWRKLEGSDPATFEMIQKIQTLQKRLINKTEEVVEKDLLIQEKERMYLELKNILARQPGPEAAEQLAVYRASLKEKARQMKAMASELNMLQAQVNEYKYEMERLVRELNDLKRKYFEVSVGWQEWNGSAWIEGRPGGLRRAARGIANAQQDADELTSRHSTPRSHAGGSRWIAWAGRGVPRGRAWQPRCLRRRTTGRGSWAGGSASRKPPDDTVRTHGHCRVCWRDRGVLVQAALCKQLCV